MNYKRFYIPNSMVFITLVTYNRNPFLLDFIQQIKYSLSYTKTKFDFEIFGTTIMHDHIHCIIKPENISEYSNIIKTFKTNFSKNIDTNLIPNYQINESKNKKGEKCIWQSRYWAHIILHEQDLYKHLDYIHYNSVKHYNIAPKDWEYSSFKSFVKKDFYDINWYNINDKYKIKELDLE